MSSFLNPKNHRLILASKSPRRKALLKSLGYEFEQRTKAVDESYPPDTPIEKVAAYLSIKKAAAYKDELKENELLITSDTVVMHNNTLLQKPKNEDQAKQMLQALSGDKHVVISGLCLTDSRHQKSLSVTTKVYFKPLSGSEIEYYVKQYQPYDKAGAYGIQEWIGYIGIEKIEGSYYNVMGLPVKELYELIQQF